MTLKTWVKQNRELIDHVIKSSVPNVKIDDEEREMWVLNDEFLYMESLAGGVKE